MWQLLEERCSAQLQVQVHNIIDISGNINWDTDCVPLPPPSLLFSQLVVDNFMWPLQFIRYLTFSAAAAALVNCAQGEGRQEEEE